MLFTVAIIFAGIGSLLSFSSFFILLLNLLVEVLKDKEIDVEPHMERYIIVGVIVGAVFFIFGGILLWADAHLKL